MLFFQRRPSCLVALLLPMLYAPPLLAAATDSPAARLEVLRQAMLLRVESTRQVLADPNQKEETRGFAQCAFDNLAAGQDARLSEDLVNKIFSVQDMNPASPSFGDIPWSFGPHRITDANSVEFAMQPIGPLFLAYDQKLSPEFKSQAASHIRAAFAAIRRHKVDVTYTNIFLMKAVNLILGGEAIGDSKAADEGYTLFDKWVQATRAAGIHEFDSPVYYSPDLDSLGLAYALAARPGAKEKFKTCLDLYWSDVAANYFVPRGTLAGAHSRDYNFLVGAAPVAAFLAGLPNAASVERADPSKGLSLLAMGSSGYMPSPAITALATVPEKVVASRWGGAVGEDRYTYVTPDFAVGAAGGAYGPQDKMVNIELAGAASQPSVLIIPDDKDAPYGGKSADKSGHVKPHHLAPYVMYVQDKGLLLVMLDLDPDHEKWTADSLATNIMFPSAADAVLLDGQRVSLASPTKIPTKTNSVLALRSGTGGVAIRIFHVDPYQDAPATLVLQSEPQGLSADIQAARLTAYSYRGPKINLPGKHLKVGILFLADRCTNDEALAQLAKRAATADIQDSTTSDAWQVTVHAGDTTLQAARNLETRAPILRQVNGKDVAPTAPLLINGQDIAARLWPVDRTASR